jgi:hypothetical protein
VIPWPTDQGVVYNPVTTQQITQAWSAVQVPCIDRYGSSQGYDIGIIDSTTLTLVDGSITLQAAPADTLAWVGSAPSVTAIFDPNACDLEDPGFGDSSWSIAGLLIRGATIDGQGRLALEPWVTVADINLIDVYSSGAFETAIDFAKPDDSELPTLHPQLVNPIGAAKTAIINTAKP